MVELNFRQMRALTVGVNEAPLTVEKLGEDGWVLVSEDCSPDGKQTRLVFGSNEPRGYVR